ncbi:hypothetical protein ACPCIX_02830 [Streptomyces pseudogriseolus]|uniref:hypothetical protein n=1 Tax=Streptomyces pseudogriseolus TaxID=36817 RepID=UPI003FA22EF7
MGVRGGGPLRGRVQGVHAGREFRAAGGRSAVVVLGPGEVGGQDVRVLLPGRGGEAVRQIGPAVRRVPLLAQHHVEAVAQCLPGAGPRVVRRRRPGVQ